MTMLDDKSPVGKADARPAVPFPKHLLVEKAPYAGGVKRVPVDRFFKQEYHDLEVERIWKKSWQWACREEEIPEVGDYMVYEVADLSFIVVRTGETAFKSYWNSCLHRGRKLCTFDGKRATEFRCMFHGWAWNTDGSMKDMTCGWDFPGTREEVTRLPEARTGVWGGYVFINPDPDCESLEAFLGELPEHFEGAGHDLGKRWKQVHVVAHLDANWKVVQEAFLEPWHVTYTHPQLVTPPTEGPPRGQRWDDFGNWMRTAYPPPTDTAKLPPGYTLPAESAQQYVDHEFDYHMNEDNPVKVGPGDKPGMVVAQYMRELHRQILGDAVDQIHDYHMNGGEMVAVWPNFHPWAGLSRLMYRFRPYKNDPDRSVMDVLLLSPWPEDRPRPPPAEPHVLDFGQAITDAKELGWLARIFVQDLGNIPYVHQGMKASRTGYVILSVHHEAPVRRWHDQYDRWMGLDNADPVAGGAG
jgi:phenylpropionate dioxygenase-like ring-hydroxylating dioxygenase large terminal subunit